MNSPYAPPASRPANSGIQRPPGNRWWYGFGLGWAALAFTFLWVVVGIPIVDRVLPTSNSMKSALLLTLLFMPTLGLLGYFAVRREWKSAIGALLAWVSAAALVLLLVAAFLGTRSF